MNFHRIIAAGLVGVLFCIFNACTNPSAPQERILKHQDGSIRRRYTLVKDVIEGEMTEYYPKTGAIQNKRTFIHGVQTGKTELFYPDGKIKEVQYYRDGKKQGGDTIFYPDGRPQFLVTFKDGKMHGPMRKWTEDGKLFFEVRYEQDSLKEVTTIMKALPNQQ